MARVSAASHLGLWTESSPLCQDEAGPPWILPSVFLQGHGHWMTVTPVTVTLMTLSSHSHRPQTLQAIAIALGYPPVLAGKTLLLKTPHA